MLLIIGSSGVFQDRGFEAGRLSGFDRGCEQLCMSECSGFSRWCVSVA